MKKRMLAVLTSVVMAAASLGVTTTLVSQASDTTTQATPKKCKKCKKVVKKAKKCKKSGNNSAKCKRLKKKAKKCKKTLRSKKCKKQPKPKPSPSPSGSAGTGSQKIEGSIQQPAPYPGDPTAPTCYAGKHRRGLILTDGANQGVDGYHFDVDPKTNGTNFLLEVTGGEGDVDLDITFYTEYGTPEQAANPQHAPPNQAFETRETGGEKGVVPQGMKVAIVCMFIGANSTFTYTAGGAGVETPR